MKYYETLSKKIYESTSKLSTPNLNIARNRIPINDYVFNPADLLPADDFIEEISSYCRIKCLMMDPTPLVRVYDFLTRPNVDKVFQARNLENNELEHFSAKLNILKDDLNTLREKLDNMDKWRLNLEYEMSRAYRKNLEEMGQYFMEIEERIDEALSVYDADKIGMIDYALETAGGKIVSTPDTVPYPSSVSWDFGYFQLLTPSSASQIIQAGNLPGQCFAFHGKMGRIRIRLAEAIKITSVTLEHTPFKLLSDISSCPRNFSVLGIEKPEDTNGTELGLFTFKNRTALQNFKINTTDRSFQYVDLFIVDNYGKEEYTCVYRFRVHGIASTNS